NDEIKQKAILVEIPGRPQYYKWKDEDGRDITFKVKVFDMVSEGDFFPGWYQDKKHFPFRSLNKKMWHPQGYVCRAKWRIDFKNFDELFKILNILMDKGYTYDVAGKDYEGLHRCEIRAGVSHQLGLGMAETALDAMYKAIIEALKALIDG
ncbi:MAG: hypothetical protein KAH32_07950, partial [Chlamydiia bacterium]|nr:hypothetical protein [Chlamydiia bacterium]